MRGLSVLAVCALVTGCARNDAPLPFSFLAPGEVQVTSNLSLPPAAATAFAEFVADGESFGAMYVSPDGELWYWRTGSFTLEDVTQEARIVCDVIVGAPCVQHATLAPASSRSTSGVPERVRDDLTRAMQRTPEGRYVAVAVMGTGAYGYGFNYATDAEAQAVALDECEKQVRSEMADFHPDEVVALAAEGVFDCRLFETFRR